MYIYIYVYVHVCCLVDFCTCTVSCVGLRECEWPRRRSRRATFWHRAFFGVCNQKQVSVGWEKKWKILPSIKNTALRNDCATGHRFLLNFDE